MNHQETSPSTLFWWYGIAVVFGLLLQNSLIFTLGIIGALAGAIVKPIEHIPQVREMFLYFSYLMVAVWFFPTLVFPILVREYPHYRDSTLLSIAKIFDAEFHAFLDRANTWLWG